MKTLACTFLSFLLCSPAVAQLVEFPIASGSPSTSKYTLAPGRAQAITPLNLPFWDDFSYTDSLTYPNQNLWQFGKSVFLNNGIGINPPSKNVVTLDGVDSVGKPYNVNDVLAKGLADKLVSAPIRLDLVDPSQRSTVYLSLFYQVQGRGEPPDAGDQLILSFKNSSNKWEIIKTIENSASLDPTVFYQVVIPVTGDQFFHNAFQFRIQNFARLSGPYDSWNVDYIYLNSGRFPTDTSYPDRTVSTPLNSMFVDYFAMPIDHFMQNPAGNLKKPSLTLFNLRVGNLQPFDYTTEVRMATKVGKKVTLTKIPLDVAQDPGTILQGLQFLTLTVNKIPAVSTFNPLADSIGMRFKYGMSTKDNVLPANNGDYDPAKYSPVDFRFNDSIRTKYVLSTYYAYDDGSAEYAAGLNQAGSYLSFLFLLKSAQPDTLTFVDIYFPDFGNNTVQSLQLEVRTNLSDAPASILYQQVIQVSRTTQNKFTRYKLDVPVIVKGDFYLGWKQPVTVSLPVGLDKNTDNGDKIYYNTNGIWVKNVNVKGSMMVRPGFGRPGGNGPVTGIEPQDARSPIYPNPTTGRCYLPSGAENIIAFDITGRKVDVEIQQQPDTISIQFLSPVNGLVIVRYFLKGKPFAEKIMVLGE